MTQSNSRPPALRALLHQIKSWPLSDKMWPDEIVQVQENIARIKSEMDCVPSVYRPAFGVALRRPHRSVEKSLAYIVHKFSTPAGRGVLPHSTQPSYATQSWVLVKPWLLENSDSRALYEFAHNIHMEIMRESLRIPHPEQHVLSDVYTTLFKIKGENPDFSLSPPNPLTDWAEMVSTRTFDPDSERVLFQQISDLVKASGLQADEGQQALILVGDMFNKAHPEIFEKAKRQMDILLSNEVPWQDVFDQLPLRAQTYINSHPACRRDKLREISQTKTDTPKVNHSRPMI